MRADWAEVTTLAQLIINDTWSQVLKNLKPKPKTIETKMTKNVHVEV